MNKTVNFDLTGKVAIVTGASRGLGIELATSLAEYGADLALMAGNEEKMKKAAADIVEKTGVKVITVKVNIADEESVQKAVAAVMDEYGRIDILVNNAGIIRYGRPEEISHKDWSECIDVDVTGTWLMSKEVVNASMMEKGGRIVNICSVNSFSASPAASRLSLSSRHSRAACCSRDSSACLGRYVPAQKGFCSGVSSTVSGHPPEPVMATQAAI